MHHAYILPKNTREEQSMSQPNKKRAIIISKRTIASHQIATLLEQHAWQVTIMHDKPPLISLERANPTLVVADIDEAELQGITLLQYFREFNPIAYTAALCAGGGSQAMRLARQVGVDGFIYLNASGKTLDIHRGLTPFFLKADQELAREGEARQWKSSQAMVRGLFASGY